MLELKWDEWGIHTGDWEWLRGSRRSRLVITERLIKYINILRPMFSE